jgi:hypothetical protein
MNGDNYRLKQSAHHHRPERQRDIPDSFVDSVQFANREKMAQIVESEAHEIGLLLCRLSCRSTFLAQAQ